MGSFIWLGSGAVNLLYVFRLGVSTASKSIHQKNMKIIIANTNINVLLKATDRIMEQYGRDLIPERIKGQATLSALKNMFDGDKYFDICRIRNAADMNGVIIPRETEEFFATLHCIPFKDMSQETREFLFAKSIDLFRGNILAMGLLKPENENRV